MIVVALDPGTEQSALVTYDGLRVDRHFTASNENLWVELLKEFSGADACLVVEDIQSYGMSVGVEVFRTVRFTGFLEGKWHPRPTHFLSRREIKLHLCHTVKATDSNIRQALIDRFGPTKERAIGTKKDPGPLYGLKGHEFAALAVAVTFWDQMQRVVEEPPF